MFVLLLLFLQRQLSVIVALDCCNLLFMNGTHNNTRYIGHRSTVRKVPYTSMLVGFLADIGWEILFLVFGLDRSSQKWLANENKAR